MLLTDVVVAVLHHVGHTLAVEVVGRAGGLQQLVPGLAYVAEQLAIAEAPARQRVDGDGGCWVVPDNSLEDGEPRQRGRHGSEGAGEDGEGGEGRR